MCSRPTQGEGKQIFLAVSMSLVEIDRELHFRSTAIFADLFTVDISCTNCLDSGPGAWIHDDIIKWKHLPQYWSFVMGIHRTPMNSPHKGQWRSALMFSMICAWTNGWANHWNASDLSHQHAHYDVTAMKTYTAVPDVVDDEEQVGAYNPTLRMGSLEAKHDEADMNLILHNLKAIMALLLLHVALNCQSW